MTHSTRVWILLSAFIILPAAAHSENEDLEGWPIVAIEFERYDIFDTTNPKTKAWFYRWANALHIISKEDFLRSMLLFKEGDPYSQDIADESARILRALGIMNPVEIRAKRVPGGVAVTVETHDQWTLKIGGQLGLFGNRADYSFDVEEENLLGLGKAAGVAYASDSERDTWSFYYFDPNIFRSRWQLRLLHENLSDGSRDLVRIDRPFYSLATRWTWGVEGRREELIDYLYSESESVVHGNRDSESWRIWGGARLPSGAEITRRLVAGWEHQQNTYSDWIWEDSATPYPPPEDRFIDGPTLSYEQIADRFIVVKGFRAWSVQEDVALGPNFSISSLWSAPAFGGDRKRLLLAGGFHAARQRDGWLVLGDAWLSGRVEDIGVRNMVAGVQLGAAQLGSNGWQIRLLAETSHELDTDRQLTLGADVGLRGWDPDYFDGTGRAVLNIQWRKLIKEEFLGLFSVGVVIFGDAGVTWQPRVGPDTNGVRLDAGAGLLFDLAHLGRSTLLRVDAALPDDGSGLTVTVSTSAIFRLPRRNR